MSLSSIADTQRDDQLTAPPLSSRPSPAPAPPRLLRDPIDPCALADLMLAAVTRASVDVVTLRADDAGYLVEVVAEGRPVSRLSVPGDVGLATAVRIARAAKLDLPIPPWGEGKGGVARLGLRFERETLEVVVSVGAGARGLDLEIHPLAQHARAQSHAIRRCTSCRAYMPAQRTVCDHDGAALEEVAEDPRPGGVIGAYRIDGQLGRGGMGEVLAGEHAIIGRRVAIKVLRKDMADDLAIVRRFLREARAASRLRHPNALEVTDFGLLADGRPYMVMERLVGESLEDVLARRGALEVRAALLVAREIAAALAAAHEVGVIHNDLKPANVMLVDGSTEAAPRLKLLDFGAAHIMDEGLDADGLSIGTPHYMSPERACGRSVDERSDLYALGVVLFEMICGHVPFDADSQSGVLYAHTRDPIPDAASAFGPVPKRVQRLIRRALAKEPAARYRSAADMIRDLDAAIQAAGGGFWGIIG